MEFPNIKPIPSSNVREAVREINRHCMYAARAAVSLAKYDIRFAGIGLYLTHAALEAGRVHGDVCPEEPQFSCESGDEPLRWAVELSSGIRQVLKAHAELQAGEEWKNGPRQDEGEEQS